MQLLLDTHSFIWFISGDKSLPKYSKKLIQNIDNKCYISVASIWEIAIKISLNKLNLKIQFSELTEMITANDFAVLPISIDHISILLELEYHHRDPFDRILISQSIVENLTMITKDKDFSLYPIKTVWEQKH